MTAGEPPRLLLECGLDDGDDLLEALRAQGWRLTPGWETPSGRFDARNGRLVCFGAVETEADAAAAVLAAARGSGVVAFVRPGSPLRGRLHEDLRRIGTVDLRPAEDLVATLAPEQEQLLDLLAAGRTLAEASRELGYSRRTISRRLADAREALGAATTAEALASHAATRQVGRDWG